MKRKIYSPIYLGQGYHRYHHTKRFLDWHEWGHGARCFHVSNHSECKEHGVSSLHHLPRPSECFQIHQPPADLYYKLFISNPDCNTDTFSIQQGVFQGDTISAIISLFCSDPLVKLASQYSFKGYVSRIPIATRNHSHLLTLPFTYSEPGWYKCQVLSYTTDGLSTISYPDHSTETLDLCLHK